MDYPFEFIFLPVQILNRNISHFHGYLVFLQYFDQVVEQNLLLQICLFEGEIDHFAEFMNVFICNFLHDGWEEEVEEVLGDLALDK